MNQYMILASSENLTEVYDVYIDTIEAHTAHEAITKFFKKYFSFDKMGTVRGSRLCTYYASFKALPILIDTAPRSDIQYYLHDIHLQERR